MKHLVNNLTFLETIKSNKEINGYTEFESVLLTFNEPEILLQLRSIFDKNIETEYYQEILAQYRHLQHKIETGWITSPRQVFISSSDCISFIHFLPNKNVNAFLRSSNIDHIFKNDVYFLAGLTDTELNVFVSIPHSFGNNLSKVDNEKLNEFLQKQKYDEELNVYKNIYREF